MHSPAPYANLLPARMLNEFVYCPRLFYYEHVEGVFVHNADTLRGAAQHTRVDNGKGALPKARKKSAKQDDANQASLFADSASDTPPAEAESGDSPVEEEEPSPPTSKEETIHARSVMLGSETLRVVAKLDLVEVTLGGGSTSPVARVCPVEYKAGAPRENGDGKELWDTDRIQLGLQILLLRENGYPCEEGIVFYRATRQRVRFVLDAETESWIRSSIEGARACASATIPAPLDHSPKCPRCSLVSICLPDETNLLRTAPDDELPPPEFQLALPGVGESNEPLEESLTHQLAEDAPQLETLADFRLPRLTLEGNVRRLITPDVETKAMYVNTPGVSVTKKGEIIVVKEQGNALAEIHIKDLHHLALFGPSSLSTALVQTLCEREIPISYFSMGGWFYGLTRGHGLTNVFTRIRQFARAAEPDHALPIARLFVYGKIRNQRTLLMRNHVEPPVSAVRMLKHASAAALSANSHAILLGVEGAAAHVYFQNFSGMIKGPDEEDDLSGLEDHSREENLTKECFTFDFTTRNRRPPKDPVNALLSLAYSLLARDCTIAAYAVGFDPYVGFYHQPRYGRPALALDVMEEFRPLISDSVVLTAINNRMIGPGDFVRAGDAVNLSASGRKRFIFAYEKRMSDTVTHPIFDYKVSYRRAIELQFRLLARTITGEISRYLPFTTR
jgi:CRISP-associated protein Cas1